MKFTGEKFIPSEALPTDEIRYEHLHRYYSTINLIKDKVVLDIACGEGYGSNIMAGYATSITGVDIDEECIKLATEKYTLKRKNLQFKTGSADLIPFENNFFDVVVSFETIEHLSAKTQLLFFEEIKRVLKPDGILIMSTPDKKNYSERYEQVNKFHLNELYRDEFIEITKKYFKYCSFFEQGFEVVSIISNAETEKNASINVHNFEVDNSKVLSRKYTIAVASNNKLPQDINSFASVVPNVSKDYFLLMDRLVAMNKEIESLGSWGNTLNKSLEEAEHKINAGNKTIQLQSESIQKFSSEKIDKVALEKQLAEVNERLLESERINQQIREENKTFESESLKKYAAEKKQREIIEDQLTASNKKLANAEIANRNLKEQNNILQSESIKKYTAEKEQKEILEKGLAEANKKLVDVEIAHQQLMEEKNILELEAIRKSSIEKMEKEILNNQLTEINKKLIDSESTGKKLNDDKIIVERKLSDAKLLLQTADLELNELKAAIEQNNLAEINQKKEIANLSEQLIKEGNEKQQAIEEIGQLSKKIENQDLLFSQTIAALTKIEVANEESLKKIKRFEQLLTRQSVTIEDLNGYKNQSATENLNLQTKLREGELLREEMNQKLHLLYQELNITKERLFDIYVSDGWKLLKKYYNLKGRILPEHSGRYKMTKRIFNYLRFKSATAQPENKVIELLQSPHPIFEETASENYAPIELPYFEHPVVSIIIPAYNAWEMNYQCIKSIIANTLGVAFEVILADDCSADLTRKCTDFIHNLVHIRSEVNLGFLNNCNSAAKFAKGKYILFLNNDTKVNPNWLSPLVTLIESDAMIGMVGSKLIYPDGRLQEAGGIIWNDASGWNYGHSQNPELPEYNYVKEVDYISGAAIMLRKNLWDQLGGFDEHFTPAYCEDSDIAFMLRKMGYKVMFQPLSEVIHYEGYSHGTDSTIQENVPSIKSYQIVNRQKLHDKWKTVLSNDHFPNAQNVFKARDKSKYKKTILVIDHYVPHFDKDAGSKTTFQYLELFASLGLNIKFLGDNFFKHEPYTTVLQQMGIEVLYGVWYRDNWQQWIKDNKDNIDFVYINRPHISIKYIDFIKEATKATILYYGHDLHFLREEMQYKIQKDPVLLESAAKWKKTEMYLFEKSDIILTPSEEENNIISALRPSFRVETILPYFFKKQAKAITNFSERNHILFVGGFGHTPNLDAVEWFSKEVWPLVSQKLAGVKFIVVGSNPPESITKLQSDSIEIKGFVSESELQATYESSRLVVVPLRYGAGVKGKTVEAMNFGLPVVSTSFGVEGMPGDSSSFIHPYNEQEGFANEIIRLYNDIKLLEKISLQEANYINTYFTHDAAAIKMKAMLGINQ